MVSITCYGGANEIGGNKILLEDKGVRIYLDFGQSFGFGEDFFYEYLRPRVANGLETYFEFDLLPRVRKLYSEKMLKLTDLKYEKPDVDAVFISHGHGDHIGHLPFLDESIPLYIGHGTHRIIELYNELYTQFGKIGEHTNLHYFKSGDKIKVGHLEIEPIHVDHSIPGAYGFIIHTSKGAIAYTGDFRLHGPRADMSEEFMKKAAKLKPYALLCEGTRLGNEPERDYSEAEVEKEATAIIKSAKGIVFASFSMCNADRFMGFYRATVKNGRILVIDTKMAHILYHLREKVPALPDILADKSIAVYFRLEKTCTFCEKDYKVDERPFMPKMVTYAEIAKEPREYVMCLKFSELMELVYIQPKDAEFIYSMSEHFYEGEDNEEQRVVWENWMKHFKIEFHKLHSSGHASAKDLVEFIKTVNPKLLIPVHTQNSEDFRKIHQNVKIPQKGEKMEL